MVKVFKKNKKNVEEKEVDALLDKLYPGMFTYLGDTKVSIGGFNPDFVDETGKRIVEFLGCYWHSCQVCNTGTKEEQEREARSLRIRAAMYMVNGYKSLFIWEHELKHPIALAARIRNFIDNGINK